MVLSVIVALILTPALTATLLKRKERGTPWLGRPGASRSRPLRRQCARLVQHQLRRGWSSATPSAVRTRGRPQMAVPADLCRASSLLLVMMFVRLPTGFLPTEDQGVAQVQFNLPAGATIKPHAAKRRRQIEDYFLKTRGARTSRAMFTVAGGGGRRRRRPEYRPRLRRAGRLDRAARASENSADAITSRATAALGDLRDVAGFRDRAARGARARPVDRLHDRAAEYRRPAPATSSRPRATSCSPPPAPTPTLAAGPPDATCPTRRRSRSISIQQKLARARAQPGRRQRDAVDRLGRPLRQRLHRSRPGEARLCPGRRAVSRDARTISANGIVRGIERADGALLVLRARPAGRPRRRRSAASTASRPTRFQGQAAPGRSSGEAMHRRWKRSPRRSRACRVAWSRPLLPGAAVVGPGAVSSTRCRCSSCSCASPRSTKAGRSRSRCCW